MNRRDRKISARQAPYVTSGPGAASERLAAPAQTAHDREVAEDHDRGAAKDYFSLAPMIVIAMLWWGIAWPTYFTFGASMVLNTAVACGVAYLLYRWLCGPGWRSALLASGLAVVLCLTWWRSSDAYTAASLGGYLAMLLLVWLLLKFAGRVHTRVSDEPERPFRLLEDDRRGYIGDATDYSNYMPIVERPRVKIEEIWTTVSTVFLPRYPAHWSAPRRRRFHRQATLAGLALMVGGVFVLADAGVYLSWFWLDNIGLAVLLIAAGWSVVGIAHELRRADTRIQVRSGSPQR